AELDQVDANYSLAAFYAGAMTYYITQAGFWATIWDDSLWGAKNTTAMYLFEDKIELGNDIARYWEQELLWELYDYSSINNAYFDLNPAAIPEVNAWNATVDLAMAIFPVAESLGDDFNGTGNVPIWETTYYNNVEFCLESSVEAAYAALENAMTDANFKYITLPTPSIIYDQDEFHLTIPEFDVTFTNNTGTFVLDNETATEAYISYLYYDAYEQPNYLSDEKMDLSYNNITEKWYLPESLIWGAILQANHSVIYHFDAVGAPHAYSNESEHFIVDYYNVTVEGLKYYYNSTDRSIDIHNVSAICYDIADIGVVEPSDILSAQWILYQKGVGATQTGEAIGVPTIDTQNDSVLGDLVYDNTTERWSSYNNDIGWVFTPTSVEYYVIVRFLLIIPVGYYKEQFMGDPIFKPYAQQQGTSFFRTRDHQVTISRPNYEFDPEI
ncbi:MAG: hypothetical protein ACTSQN_16310, partial [Candidatus Heimdallarchaeota archaeon]